MSTCARFSPSLLALVFAAAPALATDATDTETAAAGRTELSEIVVTAEKRTSTVQETPISMTALTGDALAQQGIVDLQGIIHDVPGISMRTAGPGQTELEMRGLSSSGGSSATVGYYLDDYPLTPPAAALNGKVVLDPDLFDLNRVEVLRGPQGTLYGAGSMGGTMKLVTNAPNLKEFEGEAEGIGSGTSGGGFNYTGNLMLNMPLIADTVALRLVGTDKYVDGWINRVVEDGDFPVPTGAACPGGWAHCTRGDVAAATPTAVVPRVNWERLQGGRAELLAQPNDALKIDVLAMYQRITMGDYDEYDLPPGIPNEHFQPFNLFEPFHDEFRLYGITVNYDLSFAQLTSATAYYSRGESQTSDVSEALYSVAALFGTSLPTFYPIPFNETDSTRQWSEELRLASTGSGPLQWIGGLYFANFESIFTEYNASVPLAYIGAGGAAANPLGIIYQAHNPYHVKSYAAFGEGTWAFTDALKLTAGLRYYKYDSRADEETSGFATDSGNAGMTFNSFTQSNSGVNPKATLSFEPTKDLTVYGTVARGFRPGGINQQIPSSICSAYQETYGQDNIWNYEVGEKARMLDRRLVVNADFFYIRWNDVQQIINQSCGYPLTVNAGRAASYGPELEIQALLSEEWTLTFSGTYTHASITSANPAATAADPAIAPGLAILNVPKYTETTSLTYTTPISTTYKFTGRVDNSYVGQETDIDFYYGTLPAYDLVNMRLGVGDDRLSAFVFADNLTNKHAELGINTTGFSWTIPSLVRVVTNQPRTVGVDLRYKF
jgi:iron complex outermembrane receptor protein